MSGRKWARVRGISLRARFRIVGAETLSVGVFLLLTFAARSFAVARWLPSVDSDLPVIGAALIFVGFEVLQLAKRMPRSE